MVSGTSPTVMNGVPSTETSGPPAPRRSTKVSAPGVPTKGNDVALGTVIVSISVKFTGLSASAVSEPGVTVTGLLRALRFRVSPGATVGWAPSTLNVVAARGGRVKGVTPRGA